MPDRRPTGLLARADDVVWRIAPDRVIVRRTVPVTDGAEEACDLFGDAALAWTALDTPATVERIGQRLADAGLERTADETFRDSVDALRTGGWIVEIDP